MEAMNSNPGCSLGGHNGVPTVEQRLRNHGYRVTFRKSLRQQTMGQPRQNLKSVIQGPFIQKSKFKA